MQAVLPCPRRYEQQLLRLSALCSSRLQWIGVGRGTIVGLTGAFAGIITIFISPLAAKMVNIAGFETVAIASGLILGGLHVVSTLLFVCRPPEAFTA